MVSEIFIFDFSISTNFFQFWPPKKDFVLQPYFIDNDFYNQM